MYQLQVFHHGTPRATEIVKIPRAAEVLTAIPELLKRHADCARIEVMLHGVRLFAVDCEGNRLEAGEGA